MTLTLKKAVALLRYYPLQGLPQTLGVGVCIFGVYFLKNRASYLLATPEQITFLTISNENIFLKTKGSGIRFDSHTKRRLEAVVRGSLLKETLTQVFSREFCKISKNTFYYRTLLVVASRIGVALTYFMLKISFYAFLTLQCLVSTKRSCILKQTCN